MHAYALLTLLHVQYVTLIRANKDRSNPNIDQDKIERQYRAEKKFCNSIGVRVVVKEWFKVKTREGLLGYYVKWQVGNKRIE